MGYTNHNVMKALLATLAASALVLVPAIASAASIGIGITIGGGGGGCSGTICGIGSNILYIINSILVPLLFAVAFIVFLYGVASAYIFSRGDAGKVADGHRLILWGIIGFVVMVSLWGLVNVIANTFGLAGDIAPPTPTSYPSY